MAPGQGKVFLSIYSGFFVFSNVIRPLRAAGAVAMSPLFDKLMGALQERFQVGRSQAILLTLLLANVGCSLSLIGVGVFGVSALTGVPVFPGA